MAIPVSEKVKTLYRLIKDTQACKALLTLYHSGFLKDYGWFDSYKNRTPIDSHGNPLPWITYPAIMFLEPRLNKSLRIFEFGSGQSTLFFSPRVHSVTSAEHNETWLKKMKEKAPENVFPVFASDSDPVQYADCAPNQERYDIVLIDAVHRNECCLSSVRMIRETGIIILDDSERTDYKSGMQFLYDHGYHSIEFWGPAPGMFYLKCTTLFYKKLNCMGI